MISRSKMSVLVVDDHAIARELLAQLLQTGGFDVIKAATGEQALQMLCTLRGRVNWLVTKVTLPGLVCGWILKDEFQSNQSGRPIGRQLRGIVTFEKAPERAVRLGRTALKSCCS